MSERLCQCEDSAGSICGLPMTAEEEAQDGMCAVCADNVFGELSGDYDEWFHPSARS
jgi:hypothetical protein